MAVSYGAGRRIARRPELPPARDVRSFPLQPLQASRRTCRAEAKDAYRFFRIPRLLY
jgi:hypothetical protein